MKSPRKNIFITAALALACAHPLFAGPVTYREAASLWTGRQAVELAPAISPAFIKEVERERGPKAAAELAEKRAKVAALVQRFKACALRGEDLATAEKYFVPEFKAEVRYFAAEGCAALKAAQQARPAPASASAENLGALAANGSLSTYEGSARFFDGASSRGAAALPAVSASGAARPAQSAAAAAQTKPSSRPLSARVPLPPSVRESMTPPARPENLGKDGRVHQAMAYWLSMRREGLAALKTGELSGAAKAKAAGKLAAGAVFHGLLWASNLDNVEIAAARLGWDVGQGAGAGVITADAAKLVFHSAVFVMMLAPIPLSKVAKAAVAGEPWALAFLGAMAAGPLNRYVFHFAD